MIYFFFLGYLAVILALGYWTNLLLSRSFPIYFYRLLVAPGVILHELSHSLFCVVTGAQIRRITLFSKKGGEVLHTQSKIPVLGQMLISLGPIIGASVALYYSSKFLAPEILSYQIKNGLSFHSFLDLFLNAFRNFLNLDYTSFKGILYLYLVLSFASAMAPSKLDLHHIYWSVGLVFSILILLGYIIPTFGELSKGIISQTSGFYLFGLGMLFFAFLISLILYLLVGLRRKLI